MNSPYGTIRKTFCINKGRRLFLLHGLFLLRAIGGILGKMAALYSWGDMVFWAIYCGIIAVLALYAFFWQKILRHIPLSTAYAHRAVNLFWGLIFGYYFFDEPITIGKAAGVALVVCGLVFFNLDWNADDV